MYPVIHPLKVFDSVALYSLIWFITLKRNFLQSSSSSPPTTSRTPEIDNGLSVSVVFAYFGHFTDME